LEAMPTVTQVEFGLRDVFGAVRAFEAAVGRAAPALGVWSLGPPLPVAIRMRRVLDRLREGGPLPDCAARLEADLLELRRSTTAAGALECGYHTEDLATMAGVVGQVAVGLVAGLRALELPLPLAVASLRAAAERIEAALEPFERAVAARDVGGAGTLGPADYRFAAFLFGGFLRGVILQIGGCGDAVR